MNKRKNKNTNKNTTKLLIMSSIIIMIYLITGTYAYFRWTSPDNTDVGFVVNGIKIIYDKGADILETNFNPTYTKEEGIIKDIYVQLDKPSNRTVTLNMYLKLDIFPTSLKESSFKWELYKNDSYLNSGNFSNAIEEEIITLTDNQTVTTTQDKYTLYLWIDGNIANPSTMSGQLFKFSLYSKGENALIEDNTTEEYFVQVSSGVNHNIALTNLGNVYTWGWNTYGQLGDGTIGNKNTPTLISGMEGRVIYISAGSNHNIALTDTGNIYTWGRNEYNQLGDGTDVDKHIPTLISGIPEQEEIVQVKAGGFHTMALTEDGRIYAWGRNIAGQLGTGLSGATAGKTVPTLITSIQNVAELSLGENYTIALTKDKKVYAWGYNNVGQLGDGTTTGRVNPTLITGIENVVQINAGSDYTVAVTEDKKVYTWGNNANGQLGDGTNVEKHDPTLVEGLSNIVQVAGKGGHVLALTGGGRVYTWGRNDNGQLGDGTSGAGTNKNTPQLIEGVGNVKQISSGYYHSVAITNDKKIYTWGRNDNGQLGDGTAVQKNNPVLVNILIIKNKRPMLVFTDDDSRREVMAKWEDILIEKNIPITIAAITGSVNVVPFLTWDELAYLRDTYGVDVISHSHSHVDLTALTETELRADYLASQEALISHGHVHNMLAFPLGKYNDQVLQITAEFFDAAVTGSPDEVNIYPFDRYKIRRVGFHSESSPYYTWEELKAQIDEAYAQKGLLIYVCHSYYPVFNEDLKNTIRDMIDYSREIGVDIVTMSEAMDTIANYHQ